MKCVWSDQSIDGPEPAHDGRLPSRRAEHIAGVSWNSGASLLMPFLRGSRFDVGDARSLV